MRPNFGFWRYLFVGFAVVCGIWTTPSTMVSAAETKPTMVVNAGVVLDLSSWIGKMSLSCINMSLSDFYVFHPQHTTTIVLHIRDSKGDVVGAVAQALELIEKSKVEVILGMESWSEAYFIMKLGEKAEVPILSFAPITSTLSYLKSPYFFRVAQNESSQVYAITAIVQNFCWKQVVAMYQHDEFGNWIIADLIEALQDVNIRVHRSVIDPDASGDEIGEELQKLKMKYWTGVVVVHMEQSLATQVFEKAEEIGMMSEGYAWIVSSATGNVLNTLNSSTLSSMQGVLGVKAHVPMTEKLHNFTTRWRRKFRRDNPSIYDEPQLDVHGLWAYDAAWALATAVDRIQMDPNFTSGVSQNGKKIRESLSKTKFKGLSGEINLVKGQLESPISEIVNVIGDGARTVGYWTPERALTRDLNSVNNLLSSSKRRGTDLRPIIWPGDSIRVPKGWGTPLNGERKLRIGVPVNNVFMPLFLNNDSISGYCIDIFDAVVAELPYPLSYYYYPFSVVDTHKPTTLENSSYDDLIVQVYEGVGTEFYPN